MVSLKLQKRLAATVLKCGRGKVWLDPNEINEISMSNSRQNVRTLVKDGLSSGSLQRFTLNPVHEGYPRGKVANKGPLDEENACSEEFALYHAKNKASRERKLARREERLAQGPIAKAAPVPAPANQQAEGLRRRRQTSERNGEDR
ncbi:60S ribosomal protein L19-2 [Hibiscus syriacus]|uniref:Ribosomal protein L19 n=1 Tax=Hibiscus syriacus TaxID=106335 RepID=A0A6A2WI14_HIBSY|nr:60S ribosomal protein L19-2 [Hibiscus syriacus]